MAHDPVIIGGCGANLASLGFAFARLGYEPPVTQDPDRVRRASHVLLPGVGAANDAMERLTRSGIAELVPALEQPVLGICLGMQLLFARSEEEDTRCLGVIDAPVRRLPEQPGLTVPEMGWNQIAQRGESKLLAGVADHGYAYFVHSYAVPVGPYTRGITEYGLPFSSVVEQGNFFGTQFHPERSSALGARVLDNFLKI